VDRVHQENAVTLQLLDVAQEALRRAANPPSPLSPFNFSDLVSPPPSPASPPLLDRKAAMLATLRNVLLLQEQRDDAVRMIHECVLPCVEQKMNITMDAIAGLTSQQVVAFGGTIRTLEDANKVLGEQANSRNQLIVEVQAEMKQLYGLYKAEVDAHQRTKSKSAAHPSNPAMISALQGEVERLRSALASQQQRAPPRIPPPSSRNNLEVLQEHAEHANELLIGIRDAVDLLQPVSLDPPSFPSTRTLTGLYEWLVSAQFRCEAMAASLPQS
jgi:hypothetical protein